MPEEVLDAETPSVESSTTPPSPEKGDAAIDQTNVPQARFQEVYKQKKDTERQLQAEREARETLAREVQELKARSASSVQEKELKLEDFDYDEDVFNQAKMDHAIKKQVQSGITEAMQRIQKEKDQAQAKLEQEKMYAAYSQRAAKYSAENPNFDKDIAANNEVKLSPVLVQAILDSDLGPQVEHVLMANAAERQRILSLPPVQQAVEFGKLEVRVNASPKNATSAPNPINPISTGSAKGIDPYSDTTSMAEFRKAMGYNF